MKRLMIGASLALLAAGPLAAQSYTAQNGVRVTGSGSSFTVAGGNGYGARGIWCAAADYARVAAGASTAQRVYVVSNGGSRNTVRFSLSARGLKPSKVTSIGNSISTPGANLTIGHAIGFCADRKLSNTSR